MNCFLDTSALLKRYIPEDGTGFIDDLFAKGIIHISSLTLTEAVSVFRRLVEVKGLIKEEDFLALKARLLADAAEGVFEVVTVAMPAIITSIDLISLRYLTPVDALILAAAVELKRSINSLCFVSFDLKLREVAGLYLPVLNPSDPG